MDLAGSQGLVRVEWKMAFALLLLLIALLLFVQSIRLYSFLVTISPTTPPPPSFELHSS